MTPRPDAPRPTGAGRGAGRRGVRGGSGIAPRPDADDFARAARRPMPPGSVPGRRWRRSGMPSRTRAGRRGGARRGVRGGRLRADAGPRPGCSPTSARAGAGRGPEAGRQERRGGPVHPARDLARARQRLKSSAQCAPQSALGPRRACAGSVMRLAIHRIEAPAARASAAKDASASSPSTLDWSSV